MQKKVIALVVFNKNSICISSIIAFCKLKQKCTPDTKNDGVMLQQLTKKFRLNLYPAIWRNETGIH